MSLKSIRIAVSGYYGCGNTGDEAVLAGIVESFRLRAPNRAVEFTVLSADPVDTERRHGLKSIHRMDRRLISETFRSSDLVISGGGSLLQDTTSLRSLLYYLWVARTAQRLHRPVMFYAQGIGPLRRAISRIFTGWVANRAARITVRDPDSAKTLRSIGVGRPPIEVTADPAFAITPASRDRVDAILNAHGVLADEPLIGISVRPWSGATPDILGPITARIASAAGRRLLFLPMQPPGDTDLSKAIASAVGGNSVVLDRPLSPAEAVGVAARMDALVGMRLHSLIFAVASDVPVVGISYDPKVDCLMKLAGQSTRLIALHDLTPESAASKTLEALEERSGSRDRQRHLAIELKERALSNVDHALIAAGTAV